MNHERTQGQWIDYVALVLPFTQEKQHACTKEFTALSSFCTLQGRDQMWRLQETKKLWSPTLDLIEKALFILPPFSFPEAKARKHPGIRR
jgi:hypothetical protein